MALNEAATDGADKIRKYGADYNHNPPNAVSFMPALAEELLEHGAFCLAEKSG